MTEPDQKRNDLALRYVTAIARYIQNGNADADDNNLMNQVEDLVPGVGTRNCTVVQWRRKVIAAFGKLPDQPIQIKNVVLHPDWANIMPELGKAVATISQEYRSIDEEWKA